ncbi:MAG: NAD-dependent epimerase/dehydratase family protein [Bryobacterales bacterium]|nr:NAD-dependent epimerase/dehydratase family protein [Bryobacterales bacterium]
MQTAVVTGAYGFIGRHLARRLAAAGYRVIGIGHGSWGREEWAGWGLCDWRHADVDLNAMLTYAEQPAVIFHCAGSGSVGFSMQHPFQDYQRSVTSTIAVLEFVRLHVPDCRVVLLSSAAVYGAAGGRRLCETEPVNPISPYGVHKKIAEDLCRSYASSFGLAVAAVRFFSVYGPELRKQLLWDASWKIQQKRHEFSGDGSEVRDFLYVSDAVELLLKIAEQASDQCPVVNGGTGEGVSIRSVLTELFRCFGEPDDPLFSGVARPGDPAQLIADCARAHHTGWRAQVRLEEGVTNYVRWFRAHAAAGSSGC